MFFFSSGRKLLLPLGLSLLLGLSLGLVWGSSSSGQPGCYQEDLSPAPDPDFLGRAAVQEAMAGTSDAEPIKRVCLTFDDGPTKNTERVLEVLADYAVPATFFVIATEYNEPYLPLIQKARQEGHQIALHSASHDYTRIYASPEAFWQDISLLQDRLAPYIDDASLGYLRFPGGSTNTVSRKYGGSGIMKILKSQAEERGFQWVDWNVCGEDAAGGKLSADEIFQNVVRSTRDQSTCVVLLHDSASAKTTPDALPQIISWYQQQGYLFCTVEELYGE